MAVLELIVRTQLKTLFNILLISIFMIDEPVCKGCDYGINNWTVLHATFITFSEMSFVEVHKLNSIIITNKNSICCQHFKCILY